MTLYLFKYCLPVLLGYTLFVGLSGRMNPLRKPEYPEERPSWFLGLWTGVSVAIVMLVGLHMAYSMTLSGVKELLPPTALFMAVLLTPGFLVYFNYRRIIASELQTSRALRASREMLKAAASGKQNRLDDLLPEFASHAENTAQRASDSIHNAQDNMRTIDTNAPIATTFLDSSDEQFPGTHQQEAANNDSALYDPGYLAASDPALEDYLDETIFDDMHYTALDLDAETLADLTLMDEQLMPLPEAGLVAEDTYADELLFAPEPMVADKEMDYLFDADALPHAEDNNTWFEIDNLVSEEQSDALLDIHSTDQDEVRTANESLLSELELLESVLQSDDATPEITDAREATLVDSSAAKTTTPTLFKLETFLAEERTAHQETARQLIATRKILESLTSGSEGLESQKTASFLQMKDELAQTCSQQKTLEANVQQETSKRLALETTVAELKGNLIMSKQEVRRSTAARAKALSTANKAIAFARQTLQVRALLEEELEQARETLSRRQSTISSLISELEHEKERTQEEVSFMVQQLVLHEKQLKARRNLEDSADSFLPVRTPKRIESQSLSPDM